MFLSVLLGLGVALSATERPARTNRRSPTGTNSRSRLREEESREVDTAETKRLYHCAMCHRDEGNGKGDLAVQMKLELKDWRDPDSLAKMRLFYSSTNGRGKMTNRTQETMRWEVVKLAAFLLAQAAGAVVLISLRSLAVTFFRVSLLPETPD